MELFLLHRVSNIICSQYHALTLSWHWILFILMLFSNLLHAWYGSEALGSEFEYFT